MSAQNARSLLHRRLTGSSVSRLAGSAPDRSGGLLNEVVTAETAIKRGLVPVVREAMADGIDVVCEIMPGVGEYVLGSRRELTELVAGAAAEGVAASRGREVCVRIARQHSGFAPTDTVLVSVSVQADGVVEDVACFETSMPCAEEEDGEQIAAFLAGKRVLVVSPTPHSARVQSSSLRRFGAVVETVCEASEAKECLRAAKAAGKRFDTLYVDDATHDVLGLLRAARDDASMGSPLRLVSTVLESASTLWLAVGAEATLVKPVLPNELGQAVSELRRQQKPTSRPAMDPAATAAEQPKSERRPSGVRRLALAEVLTSVAVGSGPDSR